MARHLVIVALLAVLACVVTSAPSRRRTERSADSSNQLTKVAVVLNNEVDFDEVPLESSRTKRSSPLLERLSRHQRSISKPDSIDNDVAFLFDDSPAVVQRAKRDIAAPEHRGNSRRERRSAAWWLHATMQLCEKYKHLCKTIEVKEGGTTVEIRIEDM